MANTVELKLTLDNQEFLVSMRKSGDTAQKSTTAMQAGVSKAKDSLVDLKNTTKQVVGGLVTLGGAFSVAASAKSAIQLQSQLTDLAFRVQRVTGAATDWRQMQNQLAPVASRTGKTTSEIAEAFTDIFEASGDLKFTEEAISAVGTFSTATGRDLKETSKLAGVLGRQFKLSGREVGDALAYIGDQTAAGGLKWEDMAEDASELGSIALAAGQKGGEGFQRMIALATKVSPKVKDMSETLMGLEQVTEKMRDPAFVDTLTAATKVKFKDKGFAEQGDAFQRLRVMLGKGNDVRMQLKAELPGREEKAVIETLMEPFEKAYQASIASGEDVKTATEKGLQAYDASLAKLGKSTSKFGDVQEQALKKMATPEGQLKKAMETLNQAFTKPEVIGAINELAKSLPALAEGLATVVGFIAKHPMLAAAGYGAAKVGMGFAQGAITQAATNFAQGAFAKSAMTSAANFFTSGVSQGTVWQGAGKAMGVAAAAIIAFEFTKAALEEDQKKKEEKATDLRSAVMESGGAKTAEEKMAAAKKLRAAAVASYQQDDPENENWATLLSKGAMTTFGLDEDMQTQRKFALKQMGEAKALEQEAQAEIDARGSSVSVGKIQAIRPGSGAGGGGVGGGKGTQKVSMDNGDQLMQALAASIQRSTLKVEVTALPAGARGPMSTEG